MKSFNLILLFCIVLAACVDEYDYNAGVDKKLMIVEGYMADTPGESIVTLSWTSNVSDYRDSVISGATVTVIEDDSRMIAFEEVSPGRYKPANNQTGQVGSQYQLQVIVGGEQYQSLPVIMEPSIELDTINVQTHAVFVTPDVFEEPPHLGYYVYSHKSDSSGKYYTFDVEETYLAKATNPIDNIILLETYPVDTLNITLHYIKYVALIPETGEFVYRENTQVAFPEDIYSDYPPKRRASFDEDFYRIADEKFYTVDFIVRNYRYTDTLKPEIYTDCWKSRKANGYKLATTEELEVNQLINASAYYSELDVAYIYENSLLVKARTLNAETYNFLKTAKSFRADGFELTSVQPGFPNGNVFDVSNTATQVFGVFYASAYNEKRFFIPRYLLDPIAEEYLKKLRFGCNTEILTLASFDPESESVELLRENDSLEYLYQRDLYYYHSTKFYLDLEAKINKGEWVMYGYALLGSANYPVNFTLGGLGHHFFLMTKNCFDCRSFGAPNKPEFWHD